MAKGIGRNGELFRELCDPAQSDVNVLIDFPDSAAASTMDSEGYWFTRRRGDAEGWRLLTIR